MEDISVATEKLKHPIKRFRDADQQDDNHELIPDAMVLFKRLPAEKKDEQSSECQPLEEFNLGSKGEK